MMVPDTGALHRPSHQRHVHYVDRSIQRSLLLAMVTLEVTLVAASIGFAYWRIIELIDASMYRMNVTQTAPTMMLFAEEGLWVMGLFAVVNIVALIVASGIWSRHENLVLQEFSGLIEKSRTLDFTGDAEFQPRHEVLALTLAWRARERARFTAIRDRMAQLETTLSKNPSPGNISALVDGLNKLLPPAEARP